VSPRCPQQGESEQLASDTSGRSRLIRLPRAPWRCRRCQEGDRELRQGARQCLLTGGPSGGRGGAEQSRDPAWQRDSPAPTRCLNLLTAGQ
jgi:hypothetical protein